MNQYFLDDALDWLRAHVTDAPEDAIAKALIEALDDDEWQGHLEKRPHPFFPKRVKT